MIKKEECAIFDMIRQDFNINGKDQIVVNGGLRGEVI